MSSRAGNRFGRFGSWIRQLSIGPKALLFSVVAMAVLCMYRTYDYWVTGFYVSDEFGYAHDAMTGPSMATDGSSVG